jgi:hypothetical protein
MTASQIARLKAWALARAGEVSTWQGLILAATVAGVNLSPDAQALVLQVGVGAAAAVSVIMKEGGQ